MTTNDHQTMRPMWFCPRCGKPFANRNNSHSCVVVPLEAHFEGRPRTRELFDALLAAVNRTGDRPVGVIVSKGRIELMTRARFVAVEPRRDRLRGHVWLKDRFPGDRFRTELIGATDWLHHFELTDETELDHEFLALLAAGREVGDQRHPKQARYRVIEPEVTAEPKRATAPEKATAPERATAPARTTTPRRTTAPRRATAPDEPGAG